MIPYLFHGGMNMVFLLALPILCILASLIYHWFHTGTEQERKRYEEHLRQHNLMK